MAKAHQKRTAKKMCLRSKVVRQQIVLDVICLQYHSLGRHEYWILFLDNSTNKWRPFSLKTKDNEVGLVDNFTKGLQRILNIKVKFIWLNNSV